MSAVLTPAIEEAAARLTRSLQGKVVPREPLASHTSFNVGGTTDLWIEPADLRDLNRALQLLNTLQTPWFVLGNGTNCLISDRGIRGAVISLMKQWRTVIIEGSQVVAQAGVSMPLLAQQTARQGLSGFEWACGIPGSVGGAVVMNAGAHGGDTAGCLLEAQLVREDGEVGWFPASQLEFSYRHSRLSDQPAIVSAARFQFQPEDPKTIQESLEEFRDCRRLTQPATSQCAGSIFKNPSGHSAGRLLDSLGARGTRVGGAEVSLKHANFIVNAGGATANDVRSLIRAMQRLAWEGAGVRLETEVLFVGDWDPEP